MSVSSPSAKAALQHLNRLKPYDGWSIDRYEARAKDGTKKSLLMLRRRNIPLSDTGFEEILVDRRTGTVVGVLSSRCSTSKKKALVLIERDGSVCRRGREIDIEVSREVAGNNNTNRVRNRQETTTSGAAISSEQNKQILQYGGAILISAVVLNVFSGLIQSVSLSLSIVLVPIIVMASFTCPDMRSFDAKKELKRVYRGQHLPEDHPEKPKGWLAETTARLTATVATELASGLGYEVVHMPLGCAVFTTVKLNSVDMECYWIGAFNKWYFIMQRKLNNSQQ